MYKMFQLTQWQKNCIIKNIQNKDCPFELKVSENAINFLNKSSTQVCSIDFVGYLFSIHDKWKIGGMVDLFGNFAMYSTDPKNPKVTKRMEKKIINYLIKTNFLILIIDPFPEFNTTYNLSLDLNKVQFIDQFLFYDYLSPEQMQQMKSEFEKEIQSYVDCEEK